MIKILLPILFIVISITRVWAGDDPLTLESNKAAIDLVQSHADYVWTLIAAALVFLCRPALPWWNAVLPGLKMPSIL